MLTRTDGRCAPEHRALSFLAFAAALASCTVDVSPPDGVTMTCAADDECPDGYTCNRSSQRCVRKNSADPDAPQLVGDAVVTPPVARLGTDVVVTFRVSEALLVAPELSFVSGGATRALTLVGSDDDARPLYTFTYSVRGDEDEAASVLDVLLVDRAGNTNATDLRATIAFDFTAPALATDAASLRIQPPPDCPLDDVRDLTLGSVASLLLGTTEPLAAAPTVHAIGPTNFDIGCSGSGFAFTCTYALGGTPPADGTYTLTATLRDRADNTFEAPVAHTLTVDTTAPARPAVDEPEAIVYQRRPWGHEATAQADAAPARSFEVSGAPGAVEGEATVIAYDGPEPLIAGELGRVRAGAGGAFGLPHEPQAFELAPVDRSAVYLSVLDSACNASADAAQSSNALATRVRDIAWTATLAGKSAGSSFQNPHDLEARPRFDPAERKLAVALSAGAHLVDAPDGSTLHTRGAARWRRLKPTSSTPPGAYVAAAYDPSRGAVLRFGGGTGCECSGLCPTTWERRSGQWSLSNVVDPETDGNPSLRRKAAVVYDLNRDAVVLFGGQAGFGTTAGLADTWEWNGRSWTELCRDSACAASKPSARYGHAMAYDVRRRRAVLFGGSSGGRETWEWDGTRWSEVCLDAQCLADRPSARDGHAMAYDAASGLVLLSGGTSGGDETWSWDGETWVRLCPSSSCSAPPHARQYHAMAFDAARGEVVLFGGLPNDAATCAQQLSDTWRWTGTSWSQVLSIPDPEGDGNPSGREGHALAYDARRQALVMVGGIDPASTCASICTGGGDGLASVDDVWEWDGTSWRQFVDAFWIPGPLGGAAVTYDSLRRRLVLTGGSPQVGALGFCDFSSADGATWEWDGVTWRRMSVGTPAARCHAGFAFDATAGNAVYFGGDTSSGMTGSTWERTGTSWAQACASCAVTARTFGRMAYSPADGRALLYGGVDSSYTLFRDTWRWSGAAWGELCNAGACASSTPGDRTQHAMVTDTTASEVLLIGGLVGFSDLAMDVWAWTGNTWSNRTDVTAPIPRPRAGHAASYDPERDRALLFGGSVQEPGLPVAYSCGGGYPQCSDTWEWSGTEWSPLVLSDLENDGEPTMREAHAMAYFPPTKETVLYGGFNSRDGTLSDSWALDAGAGSRPGHVFFVRLESAGVAGDETLTNLAVRWLAGGQGLPGPSGNPAPGATLHLWDTTQWRAVSTTPAGPSAPALLAWNAADDPSFVTPGGNDLARLPVGLPREIGVAVAPTYANGVGYGELATDYMEVTVSYRLPAP